MLGFLQPSSFPKALSCPEGGSAKQVRNSESPMCTYYLARLWLLAIAFAVAEASNEEMQQALGASHPFVGQRQIKRAAQPCREIFEPLTRIYQSLGWHDSLVLSLGFTERFSE